MKSLSRKFSEVLGKLGCWCAIRSTAIAIPLAVSAIAASEDVDWEAEDGSFPDHGGCVYLGSGQTGGHVWGASDHLRAMTQRAKETQRVLSLIPQPRSARVPFRGAGAVPASASSLPCSGIDDCVKKTAWVAGVPLTYLTTDAEFLRRVRLDLTGRIPTSDEVVAFLADTSDEKRRNLVEFLLQTPEWADRWALFFGDLFRNTVRTPQVRRYPDGRDSLHLYLLESMQANTPYDQLAREMLAAEGTSDGRTYPDTFSTYEQFASTYLNYDDNPVRPSAVGYVVGGRTPGGPVQDTYDSLAYFTARDFLGISTVDCVLCHDGAGHLEGLSAWGERATRLEAWGLASFFSDLRRLQSWRVRRRTLPRRPDGRPVIPNYYTIRDLAPGELDRTNRGDTAGEYLGQTRGGNRPDRYHSEQYVAPAYPFGGSAAVDSTLRLREQLGIHLTADPQFARAAVNYVWKEFFARGIVEPADQFDLIRLDPASPPPDGWGIQPSHPRLLAWLADGFRESGFDLKWLMREIANSQTYQLSSRYDGVYSPEYEQFFVRHQARRLSAEQLHDALLIAGGKPANYNVSRTLRNLQFAMQFPDVNRVPSGGRNAGNARDLLRAFTPGDRMQTPRSTEGSPLQFLNLMNNRLVLEMTNIRQRPGTLAGLIALGDSDFATALYLTVLSRPPTTEEVALAVAHLSEEGADRRKRARDLMWALFNRADFYTNY